MDEPWMSLKILVSPVQSRPCPLSNLATRLELRGFVFCVAAQKVAHTAKVQPNFEMYAHGQR